MANIVNKIGYAMSLREPQKEALSYLAAISENCNYQTDDKSTVEKVATQYCDPEGNISMDEEWNVNGSYASIEGITSPDGRCLGKMAHSERRDIAVAMNIYGEQDLKLFESGVAYFK